MLSAGATASELLGNQLARYSAAVTSLIRREWRWFLLFTLSGGALRLFFIFNYPEVQGDSFVYGDIAKNWLLQEVYGLTENGIPTPTYIRLPGYPAFLLMVFKIFGMEHYSAAMILQMFVDLASCFLIALLTWETLRDREKSNDRVAKAAFALAALCPFTANYVAAPLSETLAIFFTVLVFLLAARAMRRSATHNWLLCGLAVGAAIMLRPDDGILLIITGGYLAWQFLHGPQRAPALRGGLALALGVLVFVLPWTVRNWRTMHRFQPLAPRYANDPEDFVPRGFNRWAKSWIVDFISVYRVYWQVDGSDIDPDQLPERAWGNSAERVQTQSLITRYNDAAAMTLEIDSEFAALAAREIHEHPLRYYVGMPLARIADMWLRPRTELLPIELDWWNYDDHEGESQIAIAMAAVNLMFLVLAIIGLARARALMWPELLWMLIAFVLVRSAFLGTLENPEPRYTLEMFSVVLALAGAAFVSRPPKLTVEIREP